MPASLLHRHCDPVVSRLGVILTTERQLAPTVAALEEPLGAYAPSFRLLRAALLDCWHGVKSVPAVAQKREL